MQLNWKGKKETITQCNGCNLIGFCMYNCIYGEVGKKEWADTSSLSFVPRFKNREHDDDCNNQEQYNGDHHALSRLPLQSLCSLESICTRLYMVHCISHLYPTIQIIVESITITQNGRNMAL